MVVGVWKVDLWLVSDENGYGSGSVGGSRAFEDDLATDIKEQGFRCRDVCCRRRSADRPRVEIRCEIGCKDSQIDLSCA